MNQQETEELNRLVDERAKKVVQNFMQSSGFTNRKITDTPTDDLQVVNRRYVNLYGTTALRPNSSIASAAQQYCDTTIGRPIFFNPNSSVWTDGAGSVS